jgi:hypothetical protein
MSTSMQNPTQPEGPAPEFTAREDVEAMINRLDKKWGEIKQLLRTGEDLLVEADANNLAREAEEEPGEDWLRSLPFQQVNFGMNPGETDALLDGAKALDPEEEIRERLVKVQWQNRGLIVYSVICTVMFLYLLFSVFFSNDSYALSPNKGYAQKAVHAAAFPETPGSTPAMAAALPVVDPTPEAAKEPAKVAMAPAGPHDTREKAVDQTTLAAIGTDQTPVVPQVEFVGSITSDKYHYRSCKWAKYIIPKKELVFHSVAEARKEGYIPCPTCRPPLRDEVRTSARDR